MRLQSEIKVIVRETVIGGPGPVVCLPMVAETKADLLNQAEDLKVFHPDLVEWRIDRYGKVGDIEDSLRALAELRGKIDDIPLILTCRRESEGGFQKISQDIRLQLIVAAIRTGDVDIVDVEMGNEPEFVESALQAARRQGVKLIFSYHNFNETPDEGFIHDKLAQAQNMGGDIAKVAVMPEGYKDVLRLLSATLRARTETVKIPIVTMSMGAEGGVTRLAGGLFGSDITFAIGNAASAPGQIPIQTLRQAMKAIYH
jgi:3-dehydroquinate dehydratase-1